MGALIALAILAVSACGSMSLSLVQLRTRATAICDRANRRMRAISPPKAESEAKAFLEQGASALASELDQLKPLSTSGAAGSVYRTAVSAVSGELAALQGAVKELGAGQLAVPVLRSLEQRLSPLQTQADGAWRALDIHACLTR